MINTAKRAMKGSRRHEAVPALDVPPMRMVRADCGVAALLHRPLLRYVAMLLNMHRDSVMMLNMVGVPLARCVIVPAAIPTSICRRRHGDKHRRGKRREAQSHKNCISSSHPTTCSLHWPVLGRFHVDLADTVTQRVMRSRRLP